jgi:hypothetical protein
MTKAQLLERLEALDSAIDKAYDYLGDAQASEHRDVSHIDALWSEHSKLSAQLSLVKSEEVA